MRVSCPACGKTMVAALAADVACDRCGCDLSRLRDILVAAAARLQLARSALATGEYEVALSYADESWSLAHNPLCVDVACLAASAGGYVGDLVRWQRRGGGASDSGLSPRTA